MAPEGISNSKDDNEPLSSRTKRRTSDVSVGSPMPKSSVSNRTHHHFAEEISIATDSQDDSSAAGEMPGRNKSEIPALVKPTKLNTQEHSLQPATDSAAAKGEAPAQSFSVSTPVVGSVSRPNTPMTGVSRTSDSSLRQPRVLRVIETPKSDIPKNETPSPSATQSVSSIQIKKHSRRPSLSSLSRPDTPGDFGSEGDPSYTSASVSRANSPPPSKIGSAPVRTVSKSQAKKERRQKAKDAEAKKYEAASTLTEEPVQAPIVGRKRKNKKSPAEPQSSVSTDSKDEANKVNETEKPAKSRNTAVSEADDQKGEASKKGRAKDKISTVAKTETDEENAYEQNKPANNTIDQMIKDSESSGIPIKDLFVERTSSLQTLLSQLHKSGDMDLNEHPLFNPSNLGQRVDMKCSAADYEILKHPIELTDENRRALLRGEPVRINGQMDGSSSLQKDRCLISPRGCILRHLSPEEEDRYLTLEKSISRTFDPFQDYPAAPITEPDATNRAGGLDALFATPENFNIFWVDEASRSLAPSPSGNAPLSSTDVSVSSVQGVPPNILSAMEADSTRSHHLAIANTAELVNVTAASVRSFAAATAKHMLGAAGMAMSSVPDLDDVAGMTDEELRSFAMKSQKELEGSRKELDTIDKKLSGLVKRNKKLAQQALATTEA